VVEEHDGTEHVTNVSEKTLTSFMPIILVLSSKETLVHSGADASLPSIELKVTDFPQRSVLYVRDVKVIGDCCVGMMRV
jgi:hypothetical protein